MRKLYEEEDALKAVCKTYRRLVNQIADRFGIEPIHTRSPRRDFLNMLDDVDEKQRDEVNSSIETAAEEFYNIGAKQGMLMFMYYISEGKITLEKNQQDELVFYSDETEISWRKGLKINENLRAVAKKHKVLMKRLGIQKKVQPINLV